MAIVTPAVGANSTLTFQRETTYGTDPGSPTGFKIAVGQGAGVSASQALIYSELLAGDPNYRDPVLGKKDAAGSFSCYLGNTMFPHVARMALGDWSTSGSTNYIHVCKIKAGSLTSWTTEVNFNLSAATQYLKSNGVIATSFKISGGAEGYPKCDVGVIAKANALSGTALYSSPTDLTADGGMNAGQLASADVKIGGSAFDALLSFSVDVEHNHYKDDFRMGQSLARSTVPRGMAKVTGTITAMFQDLTLYNILTGGAASSLDLKYSSGANNYVRIYVPRAFFSRKDPVLNSDGPITLSADFQGVYDNTAQTSFQIDIGNQTVGTTY